MPQAASYALRIAQRFENETLKIILKDSLTGLYYGGDRTWATDAAGAMAFGSSNEAAALALAEKLETVNVILRYDDPTCELTLPLAMCVPNAARVGSKPWAPATAPRSSNAAAGSRSKA